jgi:hypothetical protein
MPTPDEQDLVTFKNGFALRDEDGKQLRGAEPFKATWTGVLYVAQEGHYELSAVASGDLFEKGDDGCHPSRWLVTIKRGQKTWIVSEQLWTDESKRSVEGQPICLQKGAYDILVASPLPTSPLTTSPLTTWPLPTSAFDHLALAHLSL